jgi:hypothetical protein
LINLLAAELALSVWGPLAGTLGFSKRSIMNGPDGKPIHAELTLRGTTLMLGPENPALGKRGAKTVISEEADRAISSGLPTTLQNRRFRSAQMKSEIRVATSTSCGVKLPVAELHVLLVRPQTTVNFAGPECFW